MSATRPIGYWIKLLDELIETDLAQTLEPFGITRRDWQLLNLVEANSGVGSSIGAELAPFLNSPNEAEDLLGDLTAAGWLRSADETFGFTESGKERLSSARAEIASARKRISDGLSREEYGITVDTLEAMCRNLGWAEDS